MSDLYHFIDLRISMAKEHLNKGDARSALNELEALAAKDFRGSYTANPEYYSVLRACMESLGMDTRNPENQIAELNMDWIGALEKGERLLRQGKAEESIGYFQRSINGNPGEYGTSSAMHAAERGIRQAQDQLNRRKTKQ